MCGCHVYRHVKLFTCPYVLAYRSTTLPQPFHDDPGDQFIIATAREENATLLTKDHSIQKFKHVRTMWS
jgi:PIN domain nuclease of toxin-antitoxin system